MRSRIVRATLAAALLAALVVVAVSARSSPTHPFSSTATFGQQGPTQPARPSEAVITLGAGNASAPPAEHGNGANWAPLLIIALIAAALGWLAWRLTTAGRPSGRRLRGKRATGPPDVAPSPVPEALHAGIDAGLQSLERGRVTDAVIRCWVRVEAAAEAAGFELRASETSTEFVDRVLRSYGVGEPALRRLSALYREARFSDHPMSEQDRHEARTCLQEIGADLARRHAPA
jgi:hypothetical protein